MKPSIKVTDLDDALEAVEQLGGSAPHVLAKAINEVSRVAVDRLKSEASSVFDRPTPFTLNAFRVFYASARTPEAAIWRVTDTKTNDRVGEIFETEAQASAYAAELNKRDS